MQVYSSSFLSKFSNATKYICITIVLALLTACQSASLGDGLQSAANQQQTQPAPIQTPVATNPDGTPNTAALPATKAVAFLPVSNAPQTAVTSLSSSIRSAAIQSQVKIVNSIQDGATYQVKGYFSALEDGAGTLLVYVWDVLDSNNKRIFRISGQERSNKKSADPWAAVTNDMITRVANTSVAQLKSWLSTRG